MFRDVFGKNNKTCCRKSMRQSHPFQSCHSCDITIFWQSSTPPPSPSYRRHTQLCHNALRLKWIYSKSVTQTYSCHPVGLHVIIAFYSPGVTVHIVCLGKLRAAFRYGMMLPSKQSKQKKKKKKKKSFVLQRNKSVLRLA